MSLVDEVGSRTEPTTASSTRGLPLGSPRVRAFLLGCYVFLLPVQIALGPERRLAPSDLFVVAYLIVTGFGLRRMRGAWTVWYPALLVTTGMGLIVAWIGTGGITQYAALQKAIGLVVLLLSMACMVDFFTTTERIRWLLRVFVAGVLVNVVVALLAYIVQRSDTSALPFINYEGVRLSGLLVDPNAFGGVVACALMLVLFTARTSMRVIPAPFGPAASAVLIVGLLLTFSRSAWIAAAFGIVAALIANARRAARALVPLIAGAAVTLPVVAFLYGPDLLFLARRPDQIGGRFSILELAIDEFQGSPVVGIGLGVFPERYGVIVHNTSAWFLAEMGLVGLVVFVGFVVSFAARLAPLTRDHEAAVRVLALAALSGHAAMLGLSLGIEALFQRQWWMILAVGGALFVMRSRQRT